MNVQFLELLKAGPNKKITLRTESTPVEICCIVFGNNGDPLTLQFRHKTYDFLRFENDYALFMTFDGDNSAYRAELHVSTPPFFTVITCINWDVIPPEGIDNYNGDWVPKVHQHFFQNDL